MVLNSLIPFGQENFVEISPILPPLRISTLLKEVESEEIRSRFYF